MISPNSDKGKDFPREILCEILSMYGEDIINNPKRVKGLLADMCHSAYEKERSVILLSLSEQIPQKLIVNRKNLSDENIVLQLCNDFQDNTGVQKDLACWVIDTWCLALKITIKSNISQEITQSNDITGNHSVIHSPKVIQQDLSTFSDTNSKTVNLKEHNPNSRLKLVLIGVISISVIGLVLFLVVPHFSQNTTSQGVSNIITAQTQNVVLQTTAPPFVPTPTDILPDNKQMWTRIEYDPVYTNIHIYLDGAESLNTISMLEVKETSPDGDIQTYQKKITQLGEVFVFKGSRNNDRIEIYVSFKDGTRYKINDEIVNEKHY